MCFGGGWWGGLRWDVGVLVLWDGAMPGVVVPAGFGVIPAWIWNGLTLDPGWGESRCGTVPVWV